MWTPPLLAIILILISISTPRLYSDNRLAYFTIYNRENQHYPNPEVFDCLIVLDEDTIFHKNLSYFWDGSNHAYFSREISEGNHIIKVHNLLYNVIKIDTLQITTSDRDVLIDISYEHIDEAQAKGLDIGLYEKGRMIYINNQTAGYFNFL